jgi:hypothetical protein
METFQIWRSLAMIDIDIQLLLIPYKIQPTPQNIQKIFDIDILSAIPRTPIAVVRISMIGPTIARELLITKAFSTSLNFKNKKAARISILPDKSLKKAIPIIAFSNS